MKNLSLGERFFGTIARKKGKGMIPPQPGRAWGFLKEVLKLGMLEISRNFAFLVIFLYTRSMLSFPEKKEYPKDFYYHRTSSPTYRAYTNGCGLTTIDVGHDLPQFFWRKAMPGNVFGIVKYERIDREPDIAEIRKKTGLKHGFIAWIPYSLTRTDIPKSWRRLWLTDHFEETGFAKIEKETSYFASWNERSKRALKKFEKSGCSVKSVSPEVFAAAFQATKVKHWHKGVYIEYYKKMVTIHPDSVRQWLTYNLDGRPIAGLAVHDYLGDHSVHLVAFTDQKSYDLQPGTGLMAEWFYDSHKKGFRYLTIDHLRNKNGPNDQKGYTAFKENFISTRLSFREAYFRFF